MTGTLLGSDCLKKQLEKTSIHDKGMKIKSAKFLVNEMILGLYGNGMRYLGKFDIFSLTNMTIDQKEFLGSLRGGGGKFF